MQQYGDYSNHDLAELFQQKVNLSSDNNHDSSHASQPALAEVQEVRQEEEAPSIYYSISQHYTHSAHVVQAVNTDQSSNTQAVGISRGGLSIYQTLAQHNIPPSSLLRSQLTLFEQADDDQRSRLIQLWSISPPSYNTNEGQGQHERHDEYQTRTLDDEEKSAWLRYQRSMLMEEHHNEGGPAGGAHSEGDSSEGEDRNVAETYITSGYELLAQRDYDQQLKRAVGANLSPSVGLIFGDRYNHATDPVYDRNMHQPEDPAHHSVDRQYGMFDQINHFQVQHQHVVTIHETEDEEMT